MGKQIVLAGEKRPVLNRDRKVATVYGSDDGTQLCQDGHYFTGSGEYKYTDEEAHELVKKRRQTAAHQDKIERERAAAQDSARRTVSPEEIDKYMATPEAKELQQLSMPKIVLMIKKAGGPVIAGEGAQQHMIAWLLKYTV